MTSTRPYLLRAMHEWMLDNDLTPQLVVDARSDDARVPRQFVKDERIVLNVSPSAVRHLSMGDERVEFMARFGGTPFQVSVATAHVLAIVARENGAGMSFPDEEPQQPGAAGTTPEPDPDGGPQSPPPGKRPRLKVVK
jgi:stringent starvation protein B